VIYITCPICGRQFYGMSERAGREKFVEHLRAKHLVKEVWW
jgi:hypothetical protein